MAGQSQLMALCKRRTTSFIEAISEREPRGFVCVN